MELTKTFIKTVNNSDHELESRTYDIQDIYTYKTLRELYSYIEYVFNTV